jgi:hypothetical protein
VKSARREIAAVDFAQVSFFLVGSPAKESIQTMFVATWPYLGASPMGFHAAETSGEMSMGLKSFS